MASIKDNIESINKSFIALQRELEASNKKILEDSSDFTQENNKNIEQSDPNLQANNKAIKNKLSVVADLFSQFSQDFKDYSRKFEASTQAAVNNGITRYELAEWEQHLNENTTALTKLTVSNTQLIQAMTNLSNKYGLSLSNLSSASEAQALSTQLNLGDIYSGTGLDTLARANNNWNYGESYVANKLALTQSLTSSFGDSTYMNTSYNSNQQMLSVLEAISTSTNDTSLTLSDHIQQLLASIESTVGTTSNFSSAYKTQISNLRSGNISGISVGMWQALSSAGINISDILSGNVSDSDWESLTRGYTSNYLSTLSEENSWAYMSSLGYGTYDSLEKTQLQGETVDTLLESLDYQSLTYVEAQKTALGVESIGTILKNLTSNLVGSSGLGALNNLLGSDVTASASKYLSPILTGVSTSFASALGDDKLTAKDLFGSSTTNNYAKLLRLVGAVNFAASTFNNGINATDDLYSDNDIANGFGAAFLGNGDYSTASGSASGYLSNISNYASGGFAIGGGWGALIGAAVGAGMSTAALAIQNNRAGKVSGVGTDNIVDAFTNADIVITESEATTGDINNNILDIAQTLKNIYSAVAVNSASGV